MKIEKIFGLYYAKMKAGGYIYQGHGDTFAGVIDDVFRNYWLDMIPFQFFFWLVILKNNEPIR